MSAHVAMPKVWWVFSIQRRVRPACSRSAASASEVLPPAAPEAEPADLAPKKTKSRGGLARGAFVRSGLVGAGIVIGGRSVFGLRCVIGWRRPLVGLFLCSDCLIGGANEY